MGDDDWTLIGRATGIRCGISPFFSLAYSKPVRNCRLKPRCLVSSFLFFFIRTARGQRYYCQDKALLAKSYCSKRGRSAWTWAGAAASSLVLLLACALVELASSLFAMEVAVERPTPVKEEKRADAKPEIAAVRIQYMTCSSSSIPCSFVL